MKFLADGMLGNISRWLRLLGYDVKYERLMNDGELLLKSMLEGRILLTSDIELFRLAKRRGLESVLVKGTSTVEGLSRLSKKLKLPLVFDQMKSRCPTCGSPLTRVAKTLIVDRIPRKTYESHSRFWLCTDQSCSKVYWRGSHWRNIEKTLAKTRERVK